MTAAGKLALLQGQEWHSRRLWSLLDMLRFHADKFVEVINLVHTIEQLAVNQNLDGLPVPYIQGQVEALEQQLIRLRLPTSAKKARQVAMVLRQPDVTINPANTALLKKQCEALTERIEHELEQTVLYHVTRTPELMDDSAPTFGPEVASLFPSIGYEVSEAGKCLALGRSTACVFHLMRVLEVGIRAVARCLGLPDPIKPAEKNWGAILQKIRDGIDAKWTTTAARANSEDGCLFDAVYASLDAIKHPWRNSTMHVENVYTDEEAEHIFFSVKALMKKIASRMNEDGDPKA